MARLEWLRGLLRGEIDSALSTLERVGPELGSKHWRPAAMLSDDDFRVAVVGPFKSGKSSLVNWLAGVDLLKADILLATDAVTEIRHGEGLSARIVLGDGSPRAIEPPSELETEWERLPPERRQAGAFRQVSAPELAGGLAVVDTPGLWAAKDGDRAERIVRAEISRADAVLCVVPAAKGVDAATLALLVDTCDATQLATPIMLVVSLADETGRLGGIATLEQYGRFLEKKGLRIAGSFLVSLEDERFEQELRDLRDHIAIAANQHGASLWSRSQRDVTALSQDADELTRRSRPVAEEIEARRVGLEEARARLAKLRRALGEWPEAVHEWAEALPARCADLVRTARGDFGSRVADRVRETPYEVLNASLAQRTREELKHALRELGVELQEFADEPVEQWQTCAELIRDTVRSPTRWRVPEALDDSSAVPGAGDPVVAPVKEGTWLQGPCCGCGHYADVRSCEQGTMLCARCYFGTGSGQRLAPTELGDISIRPMPDPGWKWVLIAVGLIDGQQLKLEHFMPQIRSVANALFESMRELACASLQAWQTAELDAATRDLEEAANDLAERTQVAEQEFAGSGAVRCLDTLRRAQENARQLGHAVSAAICYTESDWPGCLLHLSDTSTASGRLGGAVAFLTACAHYRLRDRASALRGFWEVARLPTAEDPLLGIAAQVNAVVCSGDGDVATITSALRGVADAAADETARMFALSHPVLVFAEDDAEALRQEDVAALISQLDASAPQAALALRAWVHEASGDTPACRSTLAEIHGSSQLADEVRARLRIRSGAPLRDLWRPVGDNRGRRPGPQRTHLGRLVWRMARHCLGDDDARSRLHAVLSRFGAAGVVAEWGIGGTVTELASRTCPPIPRGAILVSLAQEIRDDF